MKREKKRAPKILRDKFGRFKSRKRTKSAPPKKRKKKRAPPARKKKPAPRKPAPAPRQVHLIPYFILDNHLALLSSYGYKGLSPIRVAARAKRGAPFAYANFSLPARFGYKEEWAAWRLTVRRWLRSIHATYGDAVVE